MGLLVAIGLGSFLLVSTVLGCRLLLLALRSRQLPECTMGLAFLVAAAIGYPLLLAGSRGEGIALSALGNLCISAGSAALGFFNWRVFRPGPAGAALFFALALAMLAGWGHQLGTASFGVTELGWSGWLVMLARLAVYGWCASESLLYHGLMRRRLALGLADPTLVARFLWWGVGAAAAAGIFLNEVVRRALELDPNPTAPGSAIPVAVLGIVSAAATWRAFGGSAGRSPVASTS